MPETVADLVRARAEDTSTGLRFEDRSWTWGEHTELAAARAAWYAADRAARGADGPPHVGVLLENVPEFSFWLAAAGLGGFVLVGLNATRRGEELARDVRSTDCDLVITDGAGAPLLEGLDLGGARVLDLDVQEFPSAPLPETRPAPEDLYLLIFTSGTTGTPKAVQCSQRKIVWSAFGIIMRTDLAADDVTYVSMPLFHSNAIITAWAPSVLSGATLALRRKFSASQFMADVRRFGATYANYVGTPLSYVLAQPAQDDDGDNTLRRVFGNEGAPADLDRFAQRFGCTVIDGFGSSEGGISISRTPDTPPGSLGKPVGDVRIVSTETGEVCPPATFDASGRLANATEAVGELVGFDGPGMFEGYWNSPDENAARLKDGRYHSGDLGYADADGFLYFAGRSLDRLRVSGENFPAAPVSRLLTSHPHVVEAVVYAVPDATAGDQVMAAVVATEDFDPTGFAQWVAEQSDASPTWVPRFVRVSSDLPRTATGKIVVRTLARERWSVEDGSVWVRDGRDLALRPFTAGDAAALDKAFAESGRALPV